VVASCIAATRANSDQSATVNDLRGTILCVRRWDVIGLWLSLTVPSFALLIKYGGWSGAIAYTIIVAVVTARVAGRFRPMTNRAAGVLAAVTWLVAVIIFALVYPRVNLHVAGIGSDDDDALNLGARALLAGQSPYAQTTYLGNVLHHLPGAFVLALPFVLAGTSALQNLFWIPLFFLAVKTETGDAGLALTLVWLVLALSPAVGWEIATGTGYSANTITVLLGLWWLSRTRQRDLAAVVWGVTLASRPNFLFIVPLAFGWFRQHFGWPVAARITSIACATAALLSVPFYVHDPARFGPLEAADRLFRFDAVQPGLGAALLASIGLLSVGLSLRKMDRIALFRNCALIQAWPVAAGIGATTLAGRSIDLEYVRYGAFFAWFVLMAVACEWSGKGDQAFGPQLVDQLNHVRL